MIASQSVSMEVSQNIKLSQIEVFPAPNVNQPVPVILECLDSNLESIQKANVIAISFLNSNSKEHVIQAINEGRIALVQVNSDRQIVKFMGGVNQSILQGPTSDKPFLICTNNQQILFKNQKPYAYATYTNIGFYCTLSEKIKKQYSSN